MKFGTNRRLRRGWCHSIQDKQVICRGENWRWVVWRGSRCQRIFHKFRIEKEEKINKNGRLRGRGHRKLLKTRERMMFSKLNMTGDMKAMRNGIIATKTFLRCTITKETTMTSTRLELYAFMRRKRDKASTTKNPKRWVVKGVTIEKLELWFVMCSWWKNTINGVHSSECGLTPKVLRRRGRNKKGVDNVKNVTMFSFCTTILLKGVRTRPLSKGPMTV